MLSTILAAYVSLYTGAIILGLLGFVLIFRKVVREDPYGSFHIALNVRPGEDGRKRPETEWLNMGYWEKAECFPDACESLALRIIKKARLIPDGHVLDVGHATGDSLLIHLRRPDIPRPKTLWGITYLPSHHARSQDRVNDLQALSPNKTQVHLYCSDAIFRGQFADHPLNPSFSRPLFTSIIAIDCAYHFAPRELFLSQSFSRLGPGGTIALGDLAVSETFPFVLRVILSRLLSIPSENMITPRIYEEQLRKIGYTHIHIEDVSQNVFPEFKSFLKSRGGLWKVFASLIGWWAAAGGCFVIVNASRPGT
ncbi:S-adenosyl-L-methionine-dependent methyltransferase [Hysterangium stoloniferum]|nr:S-adenosyl-L-methionine-dependent methyltransferase [Hysterangium stoloniferum]